VCGKLAPVISQDTQDDVDDVFDDGPASSSAPTAGVSRSDKRIEDENDVEGDNDSDDGLLRTRSNNKTVSTSSY
jgi:hypothetical protein